MRPPISRDRTRHVVIAGDPPDCQVSSYKGMVIGSSLGTIAGLTLGYVRNNNNPGCNMLGWGLLGSFTGAGAGSALGLIGCQ